MIDALNSFYFYWCLEIVLKFTKTLPKCKSVTPWCMFVQLVVEWARATAVAWEQSQFYCFYCCSPPLRHHHRQHHHQHHHNIIINTIVNCYLSCHCHVIFFFIVIILMTWEESQFYHFYCCFPRLQQHRLIYYTPTPSNCPKITIRTQ